MQDGNADSSRRKVAQVYAPLLAIVLIFVAAVVIFGHKPAEEGLDDGHHWGTPYGEWQHRLYVDAEGHLFLNGESILMADLLPGVEVMPPAPEEEFPEPLDHWHVLIQAHPESPAGVMIGIQALLESNGMGVQMSAASPETIEQFAETDPLTAGT